MPFADGFPFSRLLEPFLRVFPYCLEVAVPRHLAHISIRDHEGLPPEARHEIEDGELVLVHSADRHRRFERPSVGKNRQGAEQSLLFAGELLVAPLHGGPQGPMSRWGLRALFSEKLKAVVQPQTDFLGGEHGHA